MARRRGSSTPRRSTALGSALRLARKPSDARAPLRDAFEIASHCGAQPLAEHARNELYAAGGRPRRQALTGPESLTPSERRVAELAAGGESNRDIARALYVTPKTVEVHLTSVYRKLGIRSRGSSRQRALGGLGGPAPGHWGQVRGSPRCAEPLGDGCSAHERPESGTSRSTSSSTATTISGRADDGTGRPKAFQGWLELLMALDGLLGTDR